MRNPGKRDPNDSFPRFESHPSPRFKESRVLENRQRDNIAKGWSLAVVPPIYSPLPWQHWLGNWQTPLINAAIIQNPNNINIFHHLSLSWTFVAPRVQFSPVLSNSIFNSILSIDHLTSTKNCASLEFFSDNHEEKIIPGYEEPFTSILSPSVVTSLVLLSIFNTQD